jgi:CheY-like chemotaxis protein
MVEMSAKKVLIVDDQRSILRLMRQLLEKFGYIAVTVDSAEEAEHILKWGGQNFSVIITDLKMPWLNGLDFCKRTKRTHPNLKIYALSGCLYDYDMNELEAAGFDGIYQKPISTAILLEILNTDIEKTEDSSGINSQNKHSDDGVYQKQ